jgi:hypothetical protein
MFLEQVIIASALPFPNWQAITNFVNLHTIKAPLAVTEQIKQQNVKK